MLFDCGAFVYVCLCVGGKWAERVSVCICTMLLWLGKCKMPILNYADLHLVPEPAQSACVVAHGCRSSAVEVRKLSGGAKQLA